ncbi:hypothetical protein QQ045_015412 [Rhodiola kirilowii]
MTRKVIVRRGITLLIPTYYIPPAVQTFWKWLSDEGIITSKTPSEAWFGSRRIRVGGRKRYREAEVVLEVTKRLWINPDAVANSEIGERVREDSKWKIYMNILPKVTDSTIFWKIMVLEIVVSYENEFQKVVEEVINPHFPFLITLDDFMWAFGMLRSRAFSRDRDTNLVIVPLADLVVIQYDLKKSNAKLALDYGFIEPRKQRDAYSLTFAIPKPDPLYQDKLDIAIANGLNETTCFDVFHVWRHLEHPVSRTNEEHVCQIIQEACKTALSGYVTNIDEDERILQGGNLGTRLEIAVRIRAGEKHVLQQVDEVFRDKATRLADFDYYQERVLRNLSLAGEQGEVYYQPKLENEHLNNVGKYRAFKSVPLPFSYYDEDKDS